MPAPCEKHGDVMQLLGAQVEANLMQNKQITDIFTMLQGIKESVDKNSVRADTRDIRLTKMESIVMEVKDDLNNGLRGEIREIDASVKSLFACLDRRKQERERAKKEGIGGFFKRGWSQFQDRASLIIVSALVVGIIYYLIWFLSKIKIFGELPAAFVK